MRRQQECGVRHLTGVVRAPAPGRYGPCRVIFRPIMAVLAAVLLAAAWPVASPAAAGPGLQATLSATATTVGADDPVTVRVTLANPTPVAIAVPAWDTPARGIRGPIFSVTRDGTAVAYTGPLAKRALPSAVDVVQIPAGGSRSWEVDLGTAWAFTVSGTYAVRLASTSVSAPSNEVLLAVAARPAPAATAAGIAPRSGTRTVTVTGCSAGQETQARAAVTNADAYAAAAVAYFDALRTGQRYVQWFGAYGPTRWNTVASHFDLIHDVTSSRNIALECASIADCGGLGVYAFVYPNQPYTVHLCSAFWTADATGTDSRAGTLIHEISHFTVVAGTDDHAYGQSAAASLASTNPGLAVDNADNHEYFAENTPMLEYATYTASSPSLEFATIRPGTTASARLTLTSSGDIDLQLSSVSATGDFAVTATTCLAGAIPPGASCTVDIAYSPSADGTSTGVLAVEGALDVVPVPVSLTGTAASPAPAAAPTTPPAVAVVTPAPATAVPSVRRLAGSASCTGTACTIRGRIPTGATRVTVRATRPGSRARRGACAVSVRGGVGTYSCRISLGRGVWRVTTQATGPTGTVAAGTITRAVK